MCLPSRQLDSDSNCNKREQRALFGLLHIEMFYEILLHGAVSYKKKCWSLDRRSKRVNAKNVSAGLGIIHGAETVAPYPVYITKARTE